VVIDLQEGAKQRLAAARAAAATALHRGQMSRFALTVSGSRLASRAHRRLAFLRFAELWLARLAILLAQAAAGMRLRRCGLRSNLRARRRVFCHAE
jgi:hypothetical protein